MKYIFINIFFLLKNQSPVVYFLLNLAIQLLEEILIYLLLLLTITLYFRFTKFLIKFKKDENISFYYLNKCQVFLSIIIVVTYIWYYIVYLRLLNYFSHEYYHYNLLLMFIFVLCLFIIISIFYINSIIANFSKKHLLKLYYYYFIRHCFFIKNIQNIEHKFANFFGRKYFYLNLLRFYGLRIVIIFSFFKNIFFDGGDINLGIMPYYSMYYLIFNIYIFLVFKLKEDFDILIAESYYKKVYFFMDINEKAKIEYKNYLLYDTKEFLFKDCKNIYNIQEIGSNILFINTYKYSINRYPNDFYSRISKLKPQFFLDRKK